MPVFVKEERVYSRDPETHIIHGAEAFTFDGGEANKAILFLHDWASSPREIRFLAEKLSARSFHCRAPLLKGHGLTPRALKGIKWNDLVDQSLQEISELKKTYNEISIVGQGFGAILALHLALRFDLNSLVLISPLLNPSGNGLGLSGNKWLARKMPEFIRGFGADTVTPIEDPEAMAAHICYSESPTEEFMDLLNASQDLLLKLKLINVPTLLIHSPTDPVAAFSGSLHLAKALNSRPRTLSVQSQGAHTLTLDKGKREVEEEVIAWILRHMG